jgi:molybdate transport system permease protein
LSGGREVRTISERGRPRPVGSARESLTIVSFSVLALFAVVIVTLLLSDGWYLVSHRVSVRHVFEVLTSADVRSSMLLSLWTSLCSLVVVLALAIPIGYALSRYRFRGHALLSTMVDVPIVLPPVVIGVSLLAFLGTGPGMALKNALAGAGISLVSGLGIVLCQVLVSVSYCIRATKAAFDEVAGEVEDVALVLGCSQWQAFRRVTLPMARNGLVAGGIMAWARAIGVFGPLMVFVGTSPRVQVMPTSIWLELSIGNIEASLSIALVMVLLASVALALVHRLAPGRQWS